jgi:hypothetical protein
MLLCSLVASAFALPSAAWATRNNGNPDSLRPPGPMPVQVTPRPGNGTIGAGEFDEGGVGHVTGPGVTKIDNSSRGPVNDVNVGAGTEDTRQSKNPKPMP